MFKPHLWRAAILPSTITLADVKPIAFLGNKRWIRSLAVATQHIETVSSLSFAALQELVVYDDNFAGRLLRGDSVNVDAVITLLDNHPHLWSLKIDLNWYHYTSRSLSPALMFAIARHPSLTNLTWHVPTDHSNNEFAKCLLFICHHKSIQEVVVHPKYTQQGCCCDNSAHCICDDYYRCPPFTSQDFLHHLEHLPECTQLRQRIEEERVPYRIAPFALRKVDLPDAGFKPWYVSLVRNSPLLQDVAFGFLDYHGASNELVHLLAISCSLRGLDLRHGHLSMYVPLRDRNLKRHATLRRLCAPITRMRQSQLRYIVKYELLQSLESLSIQMRDLSIGEHGGVLRVKDVPPVLAAFPRLRELDLGSVRVFVEERTEGEQGCLCLQDEEELDSMATVARQWDCRPEFQERGGMGDWWEHWSLALSFMKRVQKAYVEYGQKNCDQLGGLRPISMRFMYPVRAFMSREQAVVFESDFGAGGRLGRGFALADAFGMAEEEKA